MSARASAPTIAVAATLVVMAAFILVPIGFIAYGAVRSDLPGAPDAQWTLEALQKVFATGPFLLSLGGTVGLAALVAALAVGFGALFAWLLARTDLKGKGFLEIVVLAPLFLSPLVSALAWIMLAGPRAGMINVTLRTLIGVRNITIVDSTSLGGVVFVMTLSFIPYGYLFASSAFKTLDASFEEAAAMSGATPFRAALHIAWPVARPTVAGAFFLIAVLACGMFSIPAVLGGGLPFIPLAVRIERAIDLSPADYAVAASIGIEVMLVSIAGLALYRRAIRGAGKFVSITGKSSRPKMVALGGLKPLAAGFFWLYGLLAIVLPYAALLMTAFTPYVITDLRRLRFSFKAFEDVATSTNTYTALENTLALGFLAPTCCVIFALAVSYGSSQSNSRLSALTDYVATVPVAIPGIVFGTGMVWAYIATPLYATFWILLLAFVVHYLPYTYRLASTAAMQIDKGLVEAARVLGSTRDAAWAKITLPLSRPALFSAWILVFVFVVREVDVVIVLASPLTVLLSIATFNADQFGALQTAAVLGLIQTLVLLAGILVARFVFRARLRTVEF